MNAARTNVGKDNSIQTIATLLGGVSRPFGLSHKHEAVSLIGVTYRALFALSHQAGSGLLSTRKHGAVA